MRDITDGTSSTAFHYINLELLTPQEQADIIDAVMKASTTMLPPLSQISSKTIPVGKHHAQITVLNSKAVEVTIF